MSAIFNESNFVCVKSLFIRKNIKQIAKPVFAPLDRLQFFAKRGIYFPKLFSSPSVPFA